MRSISWLEYDKVGTILLMLFLTVCVIEYFSRYLAALIRKERTIKKEQARLLLLFLAALFLICTAYPFPAGFFQNQSTDFAKYVCWLSAARLELLFLGCKRWAWVSFTGNSVHCFYWNGNRSHCICTAGFSKHQTFSYLLLCPFFLTW